VEPTSGEFFALAVPHNDKEVFQVFLEELAKATENRKITLVLDNASWHKVRTIEWHGIEPLFLAPYSPDLNSIENLWRLLKINFFNSWYAKTIEELIERVCLALSWLTLNPEKVAQTTSMTYLLR
jgi:transposase